jgi:excisionase family DNA binding protein
MVMEEHDADVANNDAGRVAAEIGNDSVMGGRRGASTSGSMRAPLLSPEDLASYLAVPLATVYRWRTRREGPRGIRVGRHVRYRVDDVERWLDDQRELRP